MMVSQDSLGTTTRAYYKKMPHPEDSDAMIGGLFVEIEWRGEQHTVVMPNSGFVLDNLALQFMAYCGVTPSTLDEIEGAEVPMVEHDQAGITVKNMVFSMGRAALERQPWAPEQ